MFPACDLSELALEDAAAQLPANKLYKLQVHPNLLHVARIIVNHYNPANASPFTPTLTIEVVPFERSDHWALWSGDECIWSPGA